MIDLHAGHPPRERAASTIRTFHHDQSEGHSTVRLQDKVTIITGAGGGMGRTAAKMFAAEGARVVCVDVTAKHGRQWSRCMRPPTGTQGRR